MTPRNIVAFAVLCGSFAGFIVQGSDLLKTKASDAREAQAKPAPSQDRSGLSGRRVFRDPETGLLRPPEAWEIAPRSQTRLRPPSAVIYQLPGGAIARQTPLEELDFAIVTRQADGTLSYSCAPGTKQVEHLRKLPEPNRAGKENGHDR